MRMTIFSAARRLFADNARAIFVTPFLSLSLLATGACVSAAEPASSGQVYASPVEPTTDRAQVGGRLDDWQLEGYQPSVDADAELPSQRPDPALEAELFELWRSFPGKTGIAVRRIADRSGNGWETSQRGDDWFPQASVAKVWNAIAIYDRIDKGELSLDTKVRVTSDDFTMFQSKIKNRVMANGPQTVTIRELLELALTKSDNTADDKLMWVAGGPAAVRAMMVSKGITGIRVGPGARIMQSEAAGVTWQQSYGPGGNWFAARNKVPYSSRLASLNAYLANPPDGARPEAMVEAMARLARGELLSPESSRRMLDTLERVTSGPQRLKGGLPKGWSFLHKTGTGQALGGTGTAYNDVGVATAPDGTRYAIAVMLSDTTAGVWDRMMLMQKVSAAVARYHRR